MGGWVMVPLVLLSFFLGFLIVERFLFYAALGKEDITVDQLIEGLKSQGAPPEGGTGIHRDFLHRLLSAKSAYGRLDQGVVEEAARGLVPELSRNLKTVAALTSAAPLLGLLGTVSGMITTFNVLNLFGTGNAKAMSGGISEALITTQFGLVVAIIGLYVGMVLTRRARHYETLVREVSVHIVRKFRL
jgi:biopolymer transport protein ExbB